MDTPPLGHSVPAHLLIGWCSKDPGRDVEQECAAWNGWAVTHVPEVNDWLTARYAANDRAVLAKRQAGGTTT